MALKFFRAWANDHLDRLVNFVAVVNYRRLTDPNYQAPDLTRHYDLLVRSFGDLIKRHLYSKPLFKRLGVWKSVIFEAAPFKNTPKLAFFFGELSAFFKVNDQF